MKLSIGNLYTYIFQEESYNFLPILEWNERDNVWTLKTTEPYYLKIEKSTPCIYIGNTHNNSIGAFLLEDKVVGIQLKSLYEG